jgi:hypothetical protein
MQRRNVLRLCILHVQRTQSGLLDTVLLPDVFHKLQTIAFGGNGLPQFIYAFLIFGFVQYLLV